MKLIKAIIKEERVDQVKKALEENEIYGMTIYDVQGRGEEKGINLQYRGGTILVDLIPKTAIEIVTSDESSKRVIDIIMNAAHTGKIGDGRIFVMPIEQSIRIRTGESVEEK